MQKNHKRFSTSIDEIKGYTYPNLHTGKDWYVDFYAFDPAKNQMRRKKIKLNHISKVGERRLYADGLRRRLIEQLEKGWNPWIEAECENAYHTFADACAHYMKTVEKFLRDGILREDTHRDYKSKLKNIEEWNKSRRVPIIYIYQFDRAFISEFLEEVYLVRKNTAQTYNNYLTFIRIFSSFLLEKQYVKNKPSDGITPISKRKIKKIRTIIEEKDIIRLCDYLSQNNKHYLLACYILHYTFVRRKEMSLLKLSYFSLIKQTLFIPGSISKNGESATVTLPEKVIHLMLDLNIFDNPSNYYLFTNNFMPGPEHKHEKQFTDYWAYHVRKDLKFPNSYQFYSLKDTGITDMLGKYDMLTVRDQARHSSIEITNKYTPQDRIKANKLITRHEGAF